MPKFVIERELPGAGDLSKHDLRGVAGRPKAFCRRTPSHYAFRFLLFAVVAGLPVLAGVGCKNRSGANLQSAGSNAVPQTTSNGTPAFSNPNAIQNNEPTTDAKAAQAYLDRLGPINARFNTLFKSMDDKMIAMIQDAEQKARSGAPPSEASISEEFQVTMRPAATEMNAIFKEFGSLSPPPSAKPLHDTYLRFLTSTWDALRKVWDGLEMGKVNPQAGSDYMKQQGLAQTVAAARQEVGRELSAFVSKWHLHQTWRL